MDSRDTHRMAAASYSTAIAPAMTICWSPIPTGRTPAPLTAEDDGLVLLARLGCRRPIRPGGEKEAASLQLGLRNLALRSGRRVGTTIDSEQGHPRCGADPSSSLGPFSRRISTRSYFSRKAEARAPRDVWCPGRSCAATSLRVEATITALQAGAFFRPLISAGWQNAVYGTRFEAGQRFACATSKPGRRNG